MKHKLKARYYIRYADDFVILSNDKRWLETILVEVGNYLMETLSLHLHPNKVFIKTVTSGIDFLGWVHFPKHRVLRTATKKKMFTRLNENNIISYQGLLSHGNGYNLREKLEKIIKDNEVVSY